MVSPHVSPTTFQSFLATMLNCRDAETKNAAANFILGLPRPDRRAKEKHDYHDVDALMDTAVDRFSIEMKQVASGESSRLGRLYTKVGGFVLKIRYDINPYTYRFVKAHELAHILAYDTSWPEPRRRFPNSQREERMCDDIAGHILMPEQFLGSRLDTLIRPFAEFRLDEIELLSKEFHVTPWQIVKRVIQRHNESDLVAILWKEESVSEGLFEKASAQAFRIVESVSPSGLFIPTRDRSFRDRSSSHVLWKAKDIAGLASAEETIRLGSLAGKLETIAFFSSMPRPCVVQIVYLDPLHVSKLSRWRDSHSRAKASRIPVALRT